MEEILELEELRDVLEAGFAEARAVDSPHVHAEIVMPWRSQFAWRDAYGADRMVNVPTEAYVHPMGLADAVEKDHGPEARFVVEVPTHANETMVAAIAHELYVRALGWGRLTFGSGRPAAMDERVLADALPTELAPLVEIAMTTDVISDD